MMKLYNLKIFQLMSVKWSPAKVLLGFTYGAEYSRISQVKFVQDSLQKIWGDITSDFLKAVFHKFYLVHSWILCPISVT